MIFNAYQDSEKGISGISVVSCGHIFAQKGRMICRPGGRSDFLLFYVAKGSECFFLDNETVARDGDFILFRPHEKQHHICTDENNSEFYFVHFNAPDDFDLWGFQSSTVYRSQASVKVTDTFEEMLEELQTKVVSYEKMCSSLLFRIFSLLERNTASRSYPQRRYFDKISFVIQFMNRNYFENLTLGDYAAMANMSKFHFLRVFKDITGETPLGYRNKIRLNHAGELLESTNLPISEIGRKCGYLSDSYFCDSFKNKLGMSPAEYRKKHM